MPDIKWIEKNTKAIRSTIIGKDVREAIADALEQLYERSGLLAIDGLKDAAEDDSGISLTQGDQE